MKVRPLAICRADFPDDSVETEDGKGFLDHGGRNVAEAIAEMLSRLGCSVETPENAGVYGWSFGWAFKGQAFWCQVSSLPPEFYLHFEGAALRKDVSPKTMPPQAEIMAALNAELGRDGRFHDILWYPCIGGTVRLEDEMAATEPLAPEPPKAIVQPTRKFRWSLFLGGWIGLIVGLALADRSEAIGLTVMVLSVLLVLASGPIRALWPRLASKRVVETDRAGPSE